MKVLSRNKTLEVTLGSAFCQIYLHQHKLCIEYNQFWQLKLCHVHRSAYDNPFNSNKHYYYGRRFGGNWMYSTWKSATQGFLVNEGKARSIIIDAFTQL